MPLELAAARPPAAIGIRSAARTTARSFLASSRREETGPYTMLHLLWLGGWVPKQSFDPFLVYRGAGARCVKPAQTNVKLCQGGLRGLDPRSGIPRHSR